MAYDDIASFSSGQANQSRQVAPLIQNIADPWGPRRERYQNQLDTLMDDPGSFASSPVYKFAYNQGLDNLRNKLAGSGMYNSGNALKAAMDYGREATSQLYFPQANLLSKLAGVDSSSPAAGALAWGNMIGRSQDQDAIASAGRNLGRGGGMPQPQQQPWWMKDPNLPPSMPLHYPNTGLPSGGNAPYSGAGGGNYLADYGSGGYMPSEGAGSGYVSSDYGTTTFDGGDNFYSPAYDSGYGGGGYDVGGGMGGGDYYGYEGDWE